MTFTFTSLDMMNRITVGQTVEEPALVHVANPMTFEQEYLRSSLRANLLVALESNRRHEDGGIRLFEAGKVYIPRKDDLPDEHEMLCGVIAGLASENSWHGESRMSDFYDAKGAFEGILGRYGIIADFVEGEDTGLHASRQAAVTVNGKRIGVIGEVHPVVLERFEIEEPVWLFELDLPSLLPLARKEKTFKAIPRFPSVVRDMALIVDAGITHEQIVEKMKGYSLVVKLELFDVYSGKQVPAGKKSMAYRLTYQSSDHTLTDKEVNKIQEQILRVLTKELGAELRA